MLKYLKRKPIYYAIILYADTSENIQPGVYKYPFKYRIPLRLPSSFEGSKGAIRYIIQIRIRRPIPFPDVTRYKCITVLEDIDVNEACYKVI